MNVNAVNGITFHLCGQCRSAWLDGDAQERLFSKLPNWFGKSRADTAESIAGAIAIEAIITVLMG